MGESDKRNKSNKIILYDDHAEIVIISPKHGIFNVIIDLDDVGKICGYCWGVFKVRSKGLTFDKFYVTTSNKNISNNMLSRYLTNCPNDYVVDHKDGNTMNNKKDNLRICTEFENGKNRRMHSNNLSGHTGVFNLGDKYINKWLAFIKVNYKEIYLGYYFTYEEAVKAREEAEIKYFGEFNRTFD